MMRPRLPFTPDLFGDDPPAARVFKRKRPKAIVDSAQSAIEQVAQTSRSADRSTDPVAAPTLFAHPRANRRALLGAVLVAYELRRSARRTIGFSVGQDGLLVSAPRWVPLSEIDAALQEKSNWIVRKLAQAQERMQRLEQSRIVWRDGVTLPYLGQTMTVMLSERQRVGRGAAAMLQGDPGAPQVPGDALRLRVALAPGAGALQLRDAVLSWLMRQARRLFQERLDRFAPRLGVQWRRLVLSNAGTRWGSANANGAIRLNWRLIHFELAVIDYVVVHELSHLRVMDHSPRFWTLVESVLPDYAARKALLSEDALPRW